MTKIIYFILIINICFAQINKTDNLLNHEKFSSLDLQEKENLKNGAMVVKSHKKQGPWPEITIYGAINAKPLEALALFTDYSGQKDYIPNMVKSEVISTPKSGEALVEYELDLPWPISNSIYKNMHKIYQINDVVGVNWNQVESSSTIESYGEANFFKVGETTYMVYKSYVVPDSILAKIFKDKAKEDVINSVSVTIKYIEKQIKNNPEKVEHLINYTLRIFN